MDHHDTGPGRALGPWPIRGRALARWGWSYLTVTALYVAAGFAVVHVLDAGALGRFDRAVTTFVAEQRSPGLDVAARIFSGAADSFTIIPLAAVAVGVALWAWRRWEPAIFLVGPLLFQSAVYLPSTLVVNRGRPDIDPIGPVPPTASWPSGHAAAAVALCGAAALFARRRAPGSYSTVVVVVVAVLLPPLVAASRVYLGMHHASDVIAGAVLGAVAVSVVVAVLRAAGGLDRAVSPSPGTAPSARIPP